MQNEDQNVTIAVSRKIRRSRILKMAYTDSTSRGGSKRRMPAIRFGGEYLRHLGFEIDGFFEMVINPDHTITIKPLDKSQTDENLIGGEDNEEVVE